MLTRRQFLGSEFYAYCQQEFDTARNKLKNFGKPVDDADRFLIQELRVTVEVFGRLLK